MKERILIVGAGVAGLYLKNRLENLGYRPNLVEKSDSIRADGAGILLGPNVQKLFRASGHEEAILARSTRIDAIHLLRFDGAPLGISDLDAVRQKSGYAAVAIHRKALHEVLFESVESSTIRLSHKVASVREIGNEVEVEFEDGTREQYDFVIGADGIHSQVRKAVFGDDGLRDTHQSCWRIVVDAPSDLDLHRSCEMWGDKKRLGIFPIGEGKVYCFLLANAEPSHASMSLAEVLGYFDAFGGDWHKVKAMATEQTELLFNPIADLAKIRLAHGRIVLIGDAGHSTTPNLGQGAAIGLESASVFAELVETHGVEKAMRLYAKARYNRVNFIRETSWKIGKIAHLASPWAQAVRNFMMKITPAFIAQKEFEKAFWKQ